ncbi:hypothetical protein PIIN_04691 [Serendipita indica DSM 11827]|uniref:BRCT domain-containing protein n=1 Tax=Serendipita indica (strain DSM 11827) TaxID=1109443 RepID=G4THG4_SERID|nr:hypothetical protein PIIN_04691 [Serendipita indica DSM 11827]
MFRGLACFSPTVTQNVRLLWQSNRGTIASSLEEFDQVEWFFGTPADHEWVSRLLERGITVFEDSWVVDCIQAGCLIESQNYVFQEVKVLLTGRAGSALMPKDKHTHVDSMEWNSEDEVEKTLVAEAAGLAGTTEQRFGGSSYTRSNASRKVRGQCIFKWAQISSQTSNPAKYVLSQRANATTLSLETG